MPEIGREYSDGSSASNSRNAGVSGGNPYTATTLGVERRHSAGRSDKSGLVVNNGLSNAAVQRGAFYYGVR